MTGDCRTLTLEGGGFEKIRASFSQDEARVNAIRFDKDGKKIEYGELTDNGYTEWTFTEEKPLLGLYGRQKDSKITQLGVITLDPTCFIEEVVEEVEVPEGPGWWEENITNSSIVTRIREGSVLLKVVLIAAVIILIMTVALIVLIKVLKKRAEKGNKRKNDIEMNHKRSEENLTSKSKDLVDHKTKNSKQGRGTDGQDVEVTDLTVENPNDVSRSKAQLLKQKTNSKLKQSGTIRNRKAEDTSEHGTPYSNDGFSLELRPTPPPLSSSKVNPFLFNTQIVC